MTTIEYNASEITICIPAYNTPAIYLEQCVGSVLNQTNPPAEILIIDDGTTLPETQVALAKAQHWPKTRLVHNQHNLGLGPAMNRALEICQTDFLLKLDSDDIARPKMVEKFAEFISTNRDFDVLGGQSEHFGLSTFASNHPYRVTRDYVLRHPWFVNHSGVVLNKHSVRNAGGYRSLRGLSEDRELWTRMILRGYRRFYNLPDIVIDYRDIATGLHHHARWWLDRIMRRWLQLRLRISPDF